VNNVSNKPFIPNVPTNNTPTYGLVVDGPNSFGIGLNFSQTVPLYVLRNAVTNLQTNCTLPGLQRPKLVCGVDGDLVSCGDFSAPSSANVTVLSNKMFTAINYVTIITNVGVYPENAQDAVVQCLLNNAASAQQLAYSNATNVYADPGIGTLVCLKDDQHCNQLYESSAVGKHPSKTSLLRGVLLGALLLAANI
jgi:hypothetical protein